MSTINSKISLACFFIPFLSAFPIQIVRHIFASGYGGYFDQPGLGWVVIYGCIMGGMSGVVCVSLYLVYTFAEQRNPLAIVFCLVAVAIAIPLIRFQSNGAENERDHFIRCLAYELFYSFRAESTRNQDDVIPPGFPVCIPPETDIEIIGAESVEFRISTGKGSLRTYTWSGGSRSISLVPVTRGKFKELAYPADLLQSRTRRWPGFDWKIHDGIARCCSLEAILDFDSADAAINWLNSERAQKIPFVYRNDGLVILWSKHIEPDTLWIMVHQLLIKGLKPSHLAGAEDQKIREITKFPKIQ